MQEVFFSIARFLEATFDWLLVPFGWMPVIAFSLILGFLGVVLGMVNAAGGFVVTDRMLEMFKKKKKK